MPPPPYADVAIYLLSTPSIYAAMAAGQRPRGSSHWPLALCAGVGKSQAHGQTTSHRPRNYLQPACAPQFMRATIGIQLRFATVSHHLRAIPAPIAAACQRPGASFQPFPDQQRLARAGLMAKYTAFGGHPQRNARHSDAAPFIGYRASSGRATLAPYSYPPYS